MSMSVRNVTITTSRIPKSGRRYGAALAGLLLLAMLLAACTSTEPAEPHSVASYGGPVPPDAQARLGKGAINVIAYAPDGNAVVAGSTIGLTLYDAATFEEVWLVPSSHQILSLAYSPDGSLLAAGLENGTVSLLDPATGETISASQGNSEVNALAWSPGDIDEDSVFLAAGFNDGSVLVTSVSRVDGELALDVLGALARDRSGVTSLAYSPDGEVLASGTRTGLVSLWSARTAQPLRAMPGGHDLGHAVRALDWLPDGTTLISGARDQRVVVWDTQTGEPIHILTDHAGEVLGITHSTDGETILSASSDGTIIAWDVQKATPLRTLDGMFDDEISVAWSSDGTRFAAASLGGLLGLWDVSDGKVAEPLLTLEGHSAPGQFVSAVAWSPDGETLASGSGSSIITWRVQQAGDTGTPSAERLEVLEGHAGMVTSLAWSPNGEMLASGSREGEVAIWDGETGEKVLDLEGHDNTVWVVAWSPDGTRLASTGSLGDTLKVWDSGTGELLYALSGDGNGLWSAAWSPDGEALAAGTGFGDVILWDVSEAGTNERTEMFRGHLNWVSSLAWSPDGSRLASASADTRIFVRLLESEKPVRRVLAGHSGAVRQVAFSPDGTKLASASQDKLVVVWEIGPDASDLPLHALAGHTDGVVALAWSPDGEWLATGSDDGTVILWQIES